MIQRLDFTTMLYNEAISFYLKSKYPSEITFYVTFISRISVRGFFTRAHAKANTFILRKLKITLIQKFGTFSSAKQIHISSRRFHIINVCLFSESQKVIKSQYKTFIPSRLSPTHLTYKVIMMIW